jgi:hypothetical protein
MSPVGQLPPTPVPLHLIIDPKPVGLQPPIYTIDLSLPPEARYNHLAGVFASRIQSLTALFDTIVQDFAPGIPVPLVKTLAKLLLRRLNSGEETAEIRGIARVTGVDLYLLVAFNVLLDLFMGCTSGGVRALPATGYPPRMVHFRTLDWGMDALRHVVVQLDYVAHASGPVLASAVTYFGFVGVLTGVREHLSMSLNFRPVHDAASRSAEIRFRAHQLLVLLGFRPSIASLLRGCLLPSATGRRARARGLGASAALADVEARFPALKTTAAYLIFCDGARTVVMEKDHRSAVVTASSAFIVAANHDEAHETAADPAGASVLETMGIHELVACSIERSECMRGLWRKAVAAWRKRRRREESGAVRDRGEDPYVTVRELGRWMERAEIKVAETHYAVVMDPAVGRFLWVKRYFLHE